MVKDFSLAERHTLRDGVARHALKLSFLGGTVRDLALRALEICAAGPARRDRRNDQDQHERHFLDPLIEFAEVNQTPTERKLALFHGEWNGDIDRVFREFAY